MNELDVRMEYLAFKTTVKLNLCEPLYNHETLGYED